MLKIHTFPLGAYQTNCYIIHDDASKTCAIIDPGYEADVILQTLEHLGLTCDAVLLTHGHFDHVGAVEKIVRETGCTLWMSQSDWSQVPTPATYHYFPLANCDFCDVQFCEEGQQINAGGLTLTVLETPGHTTGSVCFLCEDHMFSGDTLFQGSCGRTDLPGGDWDTIVESLKRLASLEVNYTVHPGHGMNTRLAFERVYNPYMR